MNHFSHLPFHPVEGRAACAGLSVSGKAALLCTQADPGGHLPPAGPLPRWALLVILLVVGSSPLCIFYRGVCTVQTVFLVCLSFFEYL